jgi:large repetitive protein
VYGSGSVNQLGGIGSDSLTGTANGQSLIGAQGNDTLSDGGFTNTVLYGGTGDDILRISNANFKRINGGLGNDTLALNGSGFNLDLTGTSDNTKLISLETIDLTGTGNNSLTLNIGAIRNLVSDIRSSVGTGSAGFRRLTVLGNSGDALTANLTGLSFVRGLNTPVGFTTYTSGNLQLTVNNAVTQTGITV